jgi:hypothetical protein
VRDSLAQIVLDSSLYITPAPLRDATALTLTGTCLVYVFEGTAKIHMLVLVPVKTRNSIDITLTRETTKSRTATTPSNSLKLSFTDVVDSSPWRPIEQRQGRYEMKIRSAEIDRGFLKSA